MTNTWIRFINSKIQNEILAVRVSITSFATVETLDAIRCSELIASLTFLFSTQKYPVTLGSALKYVKQFSYVDKKAATLLSIHSLGLRWLIEII